MQMEPITNSAIAQLIGGPSFGKGNRESPRIKEAAGGCEDAIGYSLGGLFDWDERELFLVKIRTRIQAEPGKLRQV